MVKACGVHRLLHLVAHLRSCNVQLEGCGKVELGATWFHGIVGNPLYEHAIQLGLMTRHEAEDSSKCSKAV